MANHIRTGPEFFFGETAIVGVTRESRVKNLKDFLKDDRGVELAEYAVGVALLVIIAIVVYNVLGRAINDKMSMVASEIEG